MKTLLKYTFATILITLAINTNANNMTPLLITPLAEEAYIDDIPFNTEHIFDSLFDATITQEFDLSDEDYIQDIPFDTKEEIDSASDASFNNFDLEDESYINDIPFSTEAIAKL